MHDEEHFGYEPELAQVMESDGPGDRARTFGEELATGGDGAASALEPMGKFAASKERGREGGAPGAPHHEAYS
jgi:hypothetical protein